MTQIEHSDLFLMDAKIEETAGALGLLNFGLETDVTALSGGQCTKVLLAKLLLEKPDILLLDEPTNHLDVVAKEVLKMALKDYSGTILMACREPEFYEDIVTVTWDAREWALKL